MVKFQLLKVSFGDRTTIDTYDQAVVEYLVEELKKHYQTDRIFSDKSQNGWTNISTKRKDNISISRQLVLNIIGSQGWEPFSVEHENNSIYFRKKTIALPKDQD